MEERSLPMIFYLNDGDTDKTGYQKLKQRAFAKALSFQPREFNITLGPEAAQKNKFNSSPLKQPYDEHRPFEPQNSLSRSRSRVFRRSGGFTQSYDSSEPPEQKEEKLTQKKILASLENMCLMESQEKVLNMRREWMKREADAYARIQDELNQEAQVWNETRSKKLSADNSLVFEMTMPEEVESVNSVKKMEGEKEQRNTELSRATIEEMNKRKECLAEISSQHSKLHQISTEVSNCLKFDDVKFRSMIASELGFFKRATEEFSHLIENCEERTLSREDLSKAKVIVASANEVYESIKTKAEKRKNEIEEEKARENQKKREEENKKIKENKKKENEGIIATMDEDLPIDENDSPPNSQLNKPKLINSLDPETARIQNVMAHYKKYLKIYNDVTASLKDFIADESLKKFRSECQKAVNVPVNAISGVSAAHLNDKLKKLHSLLSGQQVLINSKPFNPTQHPLGLTYSTYLLAEKIVSQGQDTVSVKPDAAFPIALIVLALWADFPQFGDLLMAVFHRVCPYLIPIYWIKEEGMSDEDYYRKLGFKYSGGEREDINMFLKREGGVVRLYFSIIISPMKNRAKPHPLDLNEAWRWLAVFTSLEPSAEITATLLFDMLEVTGHALKKTYEKQFFKLIHLICVQYLPKIEKATPAGKGGPVSRLKSFLEQLIRTQSVKPPKGLLPPNFW